MKKRIVLIVLFLLAISSIGCQDRSPKSSNTQTQPEINPEVESVTKPEEIGTVKTDCSTLDPHPVAEGMVEKFDVSYEEIMGWYCEGSAFSDILLALETTKLSDTTVPELLILVKTQTWDEIWRELGISVD